MDNQHEYIRQNNPVSSQLISFTQSYIQDCQVFGEFTFSVNDIEEIISNIIQEKNSRILPPDQELFDWIVYCNLESDKPDPVPSKLESRFLYIADDLLRSGKGNVYCSECDAEI